MSKEAAIAFLKKAVEDADLQKKLLQLAAQQGYTFTVDELTDADLGGIAGGLLTAPTKGDTTTQNIVEQSQTAFNSN